MESMIEGFTGCFLSLGSLSGIKKFVQTGLELIRRDRWIREVGIVSQPGDDLLGQGYDLCFSVWKTHVQTSLL